jgi:two-component system response regulator DevR
MSLKKRLTAPVRPRAGRTAADIRIVIADSQAIDRGGMVGLLENESDFSVVGEAATVPEAIEQCRALKPAVLVLSLNLPGQEKAPAIPIIRAALPMLRIIALSERGAANCLVLNPPSRDRTPPGLEVLCASGTDCLQLAVAQGAMGTLRRSADPEDLFRAIRAVARGQAWYDPTTANALLGSSAPGTRRGENARRDLSERERDVAALLSEGLSNKEISSTLEIGEPTVKKYVGRILAKLGVQDRLQAGLFVARHPLLLRRGSGEPARRP